ncbi:MAG: hypothetical protein HQ517_07680 [SAR324 cluster bacterium]|nr:hypothetical protein [SAR324 cluster bacterium]
MIFLYGFLLTIGILLIVILSIPVKVRLESNLVFLVQWIFLTVRIIIDRNNVRTELLLFNKAVTKRKKSEQKPTAENKKTKKKKPKKKIPFSMLKDILQDVAVKKVLFHSVHLILRFFYAIKIRFLKWNIGLTDYYWQGILFGIVSGLPKTKRVDIQGNFEEINDFLLIIQISIWRVLAAVAIFLFFFPYFRTIRIYLRVRAVTLVGKQ